MDFLGMAGFVVIYAHVMLPKSMSTVCILDLNYRVGLL